MTRSTRQPGIGQAAGEQSASEISRISGEYTRDSIIVEFLS